jgi:hypothetical protein
MSKIVKGELIAGTGTILTCPKCHAHIGRLQRPLYQGWTFGLDAIRFDEGQAPDRNKPKAECRKCGAPYSEMTTSLKAGQRTWIHTAHGWLPPVPEVTAAVQGAIRRIN